MTRLDREPPKKYTQTRMAQIVAATIMTNNADCITTYVLTQSLTSFPSEMRLMCVLVKPRSEMELTAVMRAKAHDRMPKSLGPRDLVMKRRAAKDAPAPIR
jgi:hypothetical protein